jgi:hypothetical protein
VASGRAASVVALLGALAVMALLAHGAPAPAFAESSLRPHQQPPTSSTATPRLIVWTVTPLPGAQTATAAALHTEIAIGVGTAIALTAQAATPVATAAAPTEPGGGGQPGGGGRPVPGDTPGVGTPEEGAATPAGGATPAGPGEGSAPGSGGAPGGAEGGVGGAAGSGAADPGGSEQGGAPAEGAAGAGSPAGAGAREEVDAFGMRKPAPWLPAVQDGVIGALWARIGPPSEETSIWRRLTGVSAETRRPGPFGWAGAYVLLGLLLVGCVAWLVAEARLRTGGVERRRRRRKSPEPPSPQ